MLGHYTTTPQHYQHHHPAEALGFGSVRAALRKFMLCWKPPLRSSSSPLALLSETYPCSSVSCQLVSLDTCASCTLKPAASSAFRSVWMREGLWFLRRAPVECETSAVRAAR